MVKISAWLPFRQNHHSVKQHARNGLITLKEERMYFRNSLTTKHLPAISSHLLFDTQRLKKNLTVVSSYPDVSCQNLSLNVYRSILTGGKAWKDVAEIAGSSCECASR